MDEDRIKVKRTPKGRNKMRLKPHDIANLSEEELEKLYD